MSILWVLFVYVLYLFVVSLPQYYVEVSKVNNSCPLFISVKIWPVFAFLNFGKTLLFDCISTGQWQNTAVRSTVKVTVSVYRIAYPSFSSFFGLIWCCIQWWKLIVGFFHTCLCLLEIGQFTFSMPFQDCLSDLIMRLLCLLLYFFQVSW